MRRFLVLLAVAAAAVWAAAPALSSDPLVPRAVEFEQPIAVHAGAGDWRSGVVHAAKRFDLVGLRWRGAAGADARIRVRDATSGDWSAWTSMAADHAGGAAAEPVWAGGADALQLRMARAPRDLRAHFVNVTGSATASSRRLTAYRDAAHKLFVTLTGAPARAQDAGGAPAIISRAEWGAESCGRPRTYPKYGSVQTAFVHHTVNANGYSPSDSAAIVRAICRYHRNSKGWYDIGYNFLVDRFGQIFEGRAGGIDQAVIGAQAEGFNGVSTGVANIGTFASAGQTAAGVQATAALLGWKMRLHGAPIHGQVDVASGGGASSRYAAGAPVTLQRVAGHRDADRTSCPGAALGRQLPQIRSLAAQAAAQLGPMPAPAGAVTLGATVAAPLFPEPVQLTGTVTDAGGAPLEGVPVLVQIAGFSGFATRLRVVSASGGTWSAQVPTQYTRTLRAVAQLPGGATATSAPLLVRITPRIDARAPARVVARRPLAVTGSVSPARANLALVIARRGSDGAFRTVASVPVKTAGGRFRATVRLRRPALHRLRVVSATDSRNVAGSSGDIYVRAVLTGQAPGRSAR